MKQLHSRCGIWLLLIVVALTQGCSGDDGSPAGPPAVATVTIALSNSVVIAGSSQLLSATVKTSDGSVLTDRVVAWSSSNVAVAKVNTEGVLDAVAPGTTIISATAGGQTGTLALTVLQIPVASVTLDPPFVGYMNTGFKFKIVATLRDAAGRELTGRSITWISSNNAIATVDAAGLVTAIVPGTVEITATSEGKSATTGIVVVRTLTATVTVNLPSNIAFVGRTMQATATLLDADGKTPAQSTVAWSSTNPLVATVNADGVITGVTEGSATIVATSDGKTGSALLTVTLAPVDPVVNSISPATLVPGGTATITGLRFDTLSSRNTVTIRGVNAPLISSTPTQITVSVPCVSSGSAPVVITAKGVPAPAFVHPVAVTARTLGVGQSLIVTTNAGSLCNELITTSNSARYLVAVFSAATSANTLVDFEIAGNTDANGAASRVVAPLARAANSDTREILQAAEQDDAHFRMLERDRRQYEESRARAQRFANASKGSTARASMSRASLNAAPLLNIGDMRDFFYNFNGCTNTSINMRTKAVYVGTKAIIWEDSANVLQSSNDPAYAGFYERLGQIFDQDQYATVRDNFGDPLLRDALTDADGRVHMVFTSRLNNSGAAAYVTSCDQFPRSVNPASNFGEVFYGQVPTTSGSNTGSTSFPDGWFYFMGRTVVHEVKHIASQSARVANNAPTFEQSWLEEGTARHAEEMWVRNYLHHVAWKANTGFGTAATNGIYCDFHPLDATCNAADLLRRPSYGMRRQFNEIRDKLVAPWDWSPYGDGTGQTGSVFYQTTWSLVRYAIDRYGTSDAAFFKALINSSTNGVTNLAAVSGASIDQLIGGWGLALYADDYPGLPTSNLDLQFRTWNLRDIYSGLNASPNWRTRFPTPFPIVPVQMSFGSWVSPRTGLRGGAHSYYEISGLALSNQLLQLRGVGGGTPSTNLRIAIARLQ